MPDAPAASCALCIGGTHTSNNEYTGTPGIPARNGFNSLCRALPGDRALLPPSSADKVLSKPGWADATPQNLTPASGRQDHTILPSAAIVSRQRAGNRSQIQRIRPAIPSRAKRCRVHRIPPRVRDDHDTPLLWGGMAKVLDVIWGVRKQKYFCKQGWTPLSTNRPTGKSPHGSESKFRSCPGRGAAHFVREAIPVPAASGEWR